MISYTRQMQSWVVAATAALLTAACSEDPQVAKQKLVASGDRYMNEQKYAEAVIQYRNAVTLDGKFGEARFKLAKALDESGRGEEAFGEYVRAADVLPTDINAQLAAGQRLLIRRQYEEARTRAANVLEVDPKNLGGLTLMGNAMAGLKDLDGAVTYLEQATDENPGSTLTNTNLGLLQMAKGDTQAAENVFKRAVQLHPESAPARWSLANYYWAAGRLDEAEAELKQALAREPKSPVIVRSLVALYIQTNRPSEVETYLKNYVAVVKDPAAELLLADFYIRGKRVADATRVLTALSNDSTSGAEAKVRLAGLAYDGGTPARAYQLLDEAIKQEPENELPPLFKARLLADDNKSEDALVLINKVLETTPQSVRAQSLKASTLLKAGATEQAFDVLTALQAQQPSNAATQLKLAEVHMLRRDYRQAAELAAVLVKNQPQLNQARLVLAKATLNLGNLSGAESELKRLAQSDPTSSDVQNLLGDLQWAKGNRGAARAAYTQAAQLKPDSLQALTGLVRADVADRKPEAARVRVEGGLAKDPNNPGVHLLAGTTYLALNDMAAAERSFQKAMELDPDNLAAYSRLGALYLQQNRLDEARRHYESAASTNTKPAAAATMVGLILSLQNKPTEARKEYERALNVDPNAAVAANNLAWDFAESGSDLDRALQLAQTAKQQLPDNAEVSDTLGWVYYKKDLADSAVSAFREGIEQDPSNPNIHYHLGLAYVKLGNKAMARESLAKALKLNPRFPGSEEARRTLETLPR